jgi:hypothetical protein
VVGCEEPIVTSLVPVVCFRSMRTPGSRSVMLLVGRVTATPSTSRRASCAVCVDFMPVSDAVPKPKLANAPDACTVKPAPRRSRPS